MFERLVAGTARTITIKSLRYFPKVVIRLSSEVPEQQQTRKQERETRASRP